MILKGRIMKNVMNKIVLLLAVFTKLAVVTAQADDKQTEFVNTFKMLQAGTKGNGELEFSSGEKGNTMSLSIMKEGSPSYMTVYADFKEAVPAEKRIVFWVKGEIGNGKSTLTTACAAVSKGKWDMHYGPSVNIRKKTWYPVVLNPVKDFRLKTTDKPVKQLKFILNNSKVPNGQTSSVQIAKVEVMEANDAAALIAKK